MDHERRQLVRQYLRVSAVLHTEEATPINVHLIDIGKAGVSLNASHQIATGLTVQLHFGVPINGNLEKIIATGRITYCTPSPPGFKVGMLFSTLEPDVQAIIAAYLQA